MKLEATILMGCAMALTAGCATRADSVAPASVPVSTYASLSCEQTQAQLNSVRQREAALTREQNNAATDDALTMAFTLLPLRSLSGGDVSRELAQARGEMRALELVVAERCPVTTPVDPKAG